MHSPLIEHHWDESVAAKNKALIAAAPELLEALEGDDREILSLSLRLSEGESPDFDNAFAELLRWCQGTLTQWSQ
jgi:hypothetical protein